MPTLVLLIGLQASGKSSFYRARFAESHTWISMDNLRGKNKRGKQHRQLHDAMQRGDDILLDNTNPTAAERAPLIADAHALEYQVEGYYFASSLQDCLVRNAGREGKARVPDIALYSTIKRLEHPSHEEGFDALYFVRLDPEHPGQFLVSPWSPDEAPQPPTS